MFQENADKVSFAFKHSVSKYTSITIDSCAAHLGRLYNGRVPTNGREYYLAAKSSLQHFVRIFREKKNKIATSPINLFLETSNIGAAGPLTLSHVKHRLYPMG